MLGSQRSGDDGDNEVLDETPPGVLLFLVMHVTRYFSFYADWFTGSSEAVARA